ncbi:hypothetical protein SUGI_0864970 [Cryptomeria japonica]|nr:hypothetical protein SUGI_0864970 [Cryptomeria japonica]
MQAWDTRSDAEKKRWKAYMFDLRQPSCIPFTLWILQRPIGLLGYDFSWFQASRFYKVENEICVIQRSYNH